MTDDEKIDVFERHVKDRQLGIAKHLADRFVADAPNDPLSQSAFAILSIVTSYFEIFEQFYAGQQSKGKSPDFFCRGLRHVFSQSQVSDADASRLYSFLRCGMYHSAMPIDRCGLTRELTTAIANDNGVILINPAILVDKLISHFETYCTELRDPICTTERQNMLTMFNLLASNAQTTVTTTVSTQTSTTPSLFQY